MITLVVYDIEDDKTRLKAANACLDYGLQRIQFSAFMGNLNHNRREELYLRLRQVLGDSTGDVHFFPICDKDLALRKHVHVGTKLGRPSL